MLAKLAFRNIRKSARDYSIYFVTLTLAVAVFYAFNTISVQADFLEGDVSKTLENAGILLEGITVFLAFVVGFLMIYANNYLMRRRKAELGLYQVLGMRRRQVGVIITIETLIAAVVSLVCGIVLGLLISQVLVFVTAQIFQGVITHFTFFFSPDAFRITILCFGVTFLVIAVLNVFSLRKKHLVDVMGSRQRNEAVSVRKPAIAIVLAVVGVALIALSYVRLFHEGIMGLGGIDNPDVNDMNGVAGEFFTTTGIMVAGTFLLLFGIGSLLLLVSQRMKKHYWRGLHMFTIRQLASRANSTTFSLGVISLVLFLAITSVTVGMGMASSIMSTLERQTPFNGGIARMNPDPDDGQTFADFMKANDCAPSSLGQWCEVRMHWFQEDDVDEASGRPWSYNATVEAMENSTGQTAPSSFNSAMYYNTMGIPFISVSDLNAEREVLGLQKVDIDDGQYTILSSMDSIQGFLNGVLADGYTIKLGDHDFSPAASSVINDGSAVSNAAEGGMTTVATIVLPDSEVQRLMDTGHATLAYDCVNIIYPSFADVSEYDQRIEEMGSKLAGIKSQDLQDLGSGIVYQSATEARQAIAALGGLISYLCIYIGIVLVISCAAILAIQQLSSTSDALDNYRILDDMGCPRRSIFGSLRAQTLVAFLTPLVVGGVHSSVAIAVMLKVISSIGGMDIGQVSAYIVGIFVVIYGIYMLIAYFMQKEIVRSAITRGRKRMA